MTIATSVPSAATSGLLGPSDPPLFSAINPEGRCPALLVADHGGRCFPAALGRLGLDSAVLDRHIAYDIGIDRVTRRLAATLDAPALIHHYSRLLLDPNRPLDDPTSICAISDGTVVPGNLGLSEEDTAARADALFHPYHTAIDERLEGFTGAGIAPAFISMHSFTTEMKGVRRPWHIGVLWADDERIPLPLMAKLAQDPNICVGDNQPYSGRTRHGYTVETHAMARGLPNVLIEIRQDLIATDDGADAWADRLAGPLREILADPGLYRALPVEAA